MSIGQNKLDIQTLLDIFYLAYKCTQRFTDVNIVTLLMEITRVISMCVGAIRIKAIKKFARLKLT